MLFRSIPIVRRTGGLRDTVIDMGDAGFGFCHDHCTTHDVMHSISRAKSFFKNKKKLAENRKKIMSIDHSWNKAADDYIKLYESF